MLRKIILLGFWVFFPKCAFAASIYIDATSKDSVGLQLVSELREKVSQSSQHKLVYSKDDAGFVIEIVTMENAPNASTMYSAVLTMTPFDGKGGFDYFMTNSVGVCGLDRVKSCASGIYSASDERIASFVGAMQRALKDREKAKP